MDLETTYYPETGEVRYWSVYQQRWIRASRVPEEEMEAMSDDEREAVLEFLAQFA